MYHSIAPVILSFERPNGGEIRVDCNTPEARIGNNTSMELLFNADLNANQEAFCLLSRGDISLDNNTPDSESADPRRSSKPGWALCLSRTGSIKLIVCPGTGETNILESDNGAIRGGEWVHLVVGLKKNKVTFLVNGSVAYEQSNGGDIPSGGKVLRVGCAGPNGKGGQSRKLFKQHSDKVSKRQGQRETAPFFGLLACVRFWIPGVEDSGSPPDFRNQVNRQRYIPYSDSHPKPAFEWVLSEGANDRVICSTNANMHGTIGGHVFWRSAWDIESLRQELHSQKEEFENKLAQTQKNSECLFKRCVSISNVMNRAQSTAVQSSVSGFRLLVDPRCQPEYGSGRIASQQPAWLLANYLLLHVIRVLDCQEYEFWSQAKDSTQGQIREKTHSFSTSNSFSCMILMVSLLGRLKDRLAEADKMNENEGFLLLSSCCAILRVLRSTIQRIILRDYDKAPTALQLGAGLLHLPRWFSQGYLRPVLIELAHSLASLARTNHSVELGELYEVLSKTCTACVAESFLILEPDRQSRCIVLKELLQHSEGLATITPSIWSGAASKQLLAQLLSFLSYDRPSALSHPDDFMKPDIPVIPSETLDDSLPIVRGWASSLASVADSLLSPDVPLTLDSKMHAQIIQDMFYDGVPKPSGSTRNLSRRSYTPQAIKGRDFAEPQCYKDVINSRSEEMLINRVLDCAPTTYSKLVLGSEDGVADELHISKSRNALRDGQSISNVSLLLSPSDFVTPTGSGLKSVDSSGFTTQSVTAQMPGGTACVNLLSNLQTVSKNEEATVSVKLNRLGPSLNSEDGDTSPIVFIGFARGTVERQDFWNANNVYGAVFGINFESMTENASPVSAEEATPVTYEFPHHCLQSGQIWDGGKVREDVSVTNLRLCRAHNTQGDGSLLTGSNLLQLEISLIEGNGFSRYRCSDPVGLHVSQGHEYPNGDGCSRCVREGLALLDEIPLFNPLRTDSGSESDEVVYPIVSVVDTPGNVQAEVTVFKRSHTERHESHTGPRSDGRLHYPVLNRGSAVVRNGFPLNVSCEDAWGLALHGSHVSQDHTCSGGSDASCIGCFMNLLVKFFEEIQSSPLQASALKLNNAYEHLSLVANGYSSQAFPHSSFRYDIIDRLLKLSKSQESGRLLQDSGLRFLACIFQCGLRASVIRDSEIVFCGNSNYQFLNTPASWRRSSHILSRENEQCSDGSPDPDGDSEDRTSMSDVSMNSDHSGRKEEFNSIINIIRECEESAVLGGRQISRNMMKERLGQLMQRSSRYDRSADSIVEDFSDCYAQFASPLAFDGTEGDINGSLQLSSGSENVSCHKSAVKFGASSGFDSFTPSGWRTAKVSVPITKLWTTDTEKSTNFLFSLKDGYPWEVRFEISGVSNDKIYMYFNGDVVTNSGVVCNQNGGCLVRSIGVFNYDHESTTVSVGCLKLGQKNPDKYACCPIDFFREGNVCCVDPQYVSWGKSVDLKGYMDCSQDLFLSVSSCSIFSHIGFRRITWLPCSKKREDSFENEAVTKLVSDRSRLQLAPSSTGVVYDDDVHMLFHVAKTVCGHLEGFQEDGTGDIGRVDFLLRNGLIRHIFLPFLCSIGLKKVKYSRPLHKFIITLGQIIHEYLRIGSAYLTELETQYSDKPSYTSLVTEDLLLVLSTLIHCHSSFSHQIIYQSVELIRDPSSLLSGLHGSSPSHCRQLTQLSKELVFSAGLQSEQVRAQESLSGRQAAIDLAKGNLNTSWSSFCSVPGARPNKITERKVGQKLDAAARSGVAAFLFHSGKIDKISQLQSEIDCHRTDDVLQIAAKLMKRIKEWGRDKAEKLGKTNSGVTRVSNESYDKVNILIAERALFMIQEVAAAWSAVEMNSENLQTIADGISRFLESEVSSGLVKTVLGVSKSMSARAYDVFASSVETARVTLCVIDPDTVLSWNQRKMQGKCSRLFFYWLSKMCFPCDHDQQPGLVKDTSSKSVESGSVMDELMVVLEDDIRVSDSCLALSGCLSGFIDNFNSKSLTASVLESLRSRALMDAMKALQDAHHLLHQDVVVDGNGIQSLSAIDVLAGKPLQCGKEQNSSQSDVARDPHEWIIKTMSMKHEAEALLQTAVHSSQIFLCCLQMSTGNSLVSQIDVLSQNYLEFLDRITELSSLITTAECEQVGKTGVYYRADDDTLQAYYGSCKGLKECSRALMTTANVSFKYFSYITSKDMMYGLVSPEEYLRRLYDPLRRSFDSVRKQNVECCKSINPLRFMSSLISGTEDAFVGDEKFCEGLSSYVIDKLVSCFIGDNENDNRPPFVSNTTNSRNPSPEARARMDKLASLGFTSEGDNLELKFRRNAVNEILKNTSRNRTSGRNRGTLDETFKKHLSDVRSSPTKEELSRVVLHWYRRLPLVFGREKNDIKNLFDLEVYYLGLYSPHFLRSTRKALVDLKLQSNYLASCLRSIIMGCNNAEVVAQMVKPGWISLICSICSHSQGPLTILCSKILKKILGRTRPRDISINCSPSQNADGRYIVEMLIDKAAGLLSAATTMPTVLSETDNSKEHLSWFEVLRLEMIQCMDGIRSSWNENDRQSSISSVTDTIRSLANADLWDTFVAKKLSECVHDATKCIYEKAFTPANEEPSLKSYSEQLRGHHQDLHCIGKGNAALIVCSGEVSSVRSFGKVEIPSLSLARRQQRTAQVTLNQLRAADDRSGLGISGEEMNYNLSSSFKKLIKMLDMRCKDGFHSPLNKARSAVEETLESLRVNGARGTFLGLEQLSDYSMPQLALDGAQMQRTQSSSERLSGPARAVVWINSTENLSGENPVPLMVSVPFSCLKPVSDSNLQPPKGVYAAVSDASLNVGLNEDMNIRNVSSDKFYPRVSGYMTPFTSDSIIPHVEESSLREQSRVAGYTDSLESLWWKWVPLRGKCDTRGRDGFQLAATVIPLPSRSQDPSSMLPYTDAMGISENGPREVGHKTPLRPSLLAAGENDVAPFIAHASSRRPRSSSRHLAIDVSLDDRIYCWEWEIISDAANDQLSFGVTTNPTTNDKKNMFLWEPGSDETFIKGQGSGRNHSGNNRKNAKTALRRGNRIRCVFDGLRKTLRIFIRQTHGGKQHTSECRSWSSMYQSSRKKSSTPKHTHCFGDFSDTTSAAYGSVLTDVPCQTYPVILAPSSTSLEFCGIALLKPMMSMQTEFDLCYEFAHRRAFDIELARYIFGLHSCRALRGMLTDPEASRAFLKDDDDSTPGGKELQGGVVARQQLLKMALQSTGTYGVIDTNNCEEIWALQRNAIMRKMTNADVEEGLARMNATALSTEGRDYIERNHITVNDLRSSGEAQTPPNTEPASGPPPNVDSESLANLKAVGFPEEKCIVALRETSGDLNAAAELLSSGAFDDIPSGGDGIVAETDERLEQGSDTEAAASEGAVMKGTKASEIFKAANLSISQNEDSVASYIQNLARFELLPMLSESSPRRDSERREVSKEPFERICVQLVEDNMEEEIGDKAYDPSSRFYPDTRPGATGNGIDSNSAVMFRSSHSNENSSFKPRPGCPGRESLGLKLNGGEEAEDAELQQAISTQWESRAQLLRPFVDDCVQGQNWLGSKYCDISDVVHSLQFSSAVLMSLYSREILMMLLGSWHSVDESSNKQRIDSETSETTFSVVRFFGEDFLPEPSADLLPRINRDMALQMFGSKTVVGGISFTVCDDVTENDKDMMGVQESHSELSAASMDPFCAFASFIHTMISQQAFLVLSKNISASNHSFTGSFSRSAASFQRSSSLIGSGRHPCVVPTVLHTLTTRESTTSRIVCPEFFIEPLVRLALKSPVIVEVPIMHDFKGSSHQEEGKVLEFVLLSILTLHLNALSHRSQKDYLDSGSKLVRDVQVLRKPSIRAAEWMTDTMRKKIESREDSQDSSKAQALLELYSIWSICLRSPLMNIKEISFRAMSEILEQARRQSMWTDSDFSSGIWRSFLTSVPAERIETLAMRRLDWEREDSPRCSRYLQALLEFTSLLRFVRERILEDQGSDIFGSKSAARPPAPPEHSSQLPVSGNADSALTDVLGNRERFALEFNDENSHMVIEGVGEGTTPLPSWTAEFYIKRKPRPVTADARSAATSTSKAPDAPQTESSDTTVIPTPESMPMDSEGLFGSGHACNWESPEGLFGMGIADAPNDEEDELDDQKEEDDYRTALALQREEALGIGENAEIVNLLNESGMRGGGVYEGEGRTMAAILQRLTGPPVGGNGSSGSARLARASRGRGGLQSRLLVVPAGRDPAALRSRLRAAQTDERMSSKPNLPSNSEVLATGPHGTALLLSDGQQSSCGGSVGLRLPGGIQPNRRRGGRSHYGGNTTAQTPWITEEEFSDASEASVTNDSISFGYSCPFDEWVHLAFVFIDGSISLYVNGKTEGIRRPHIRISPGVFLPNNTVGYNTHSFRGQIHEVRLWQHARSPLELERDLHRQLCVTHFMPSLVGYWTFNEGRGKHVRDYTGRFDKCIVKNAAWITINDAPTDLELTTRSSDNFVEGALETPKETFFSKSSASLSASRPTKSSESTDDSSVCPDLGTWNQYVGRISCMGQNSLVASWRNDTIYTLHISFDKFYDGNEAEKASSIFDGLISRHSHTQNRHDVSNFPHKYFIHGTIELPDYLAKIPLLGKLSCSTEWDTRVPVSSGRIEVFARDIKTGTPELLSWIRNSLFLGKLSGSTVEGEWYNSVSTDCVEVAKPGDMWFHHLLHSEQCKISSDGMEAVHVGDGDGWGMCIIQPIAPDSQLANNLSSTEPMNPSWPNTMENSEMNLSWCDVMQGGLTSGMWLWEAEIVQLNNPISVSIGVTRPNVQFGEFLGETGESWGWQNNGELWHKGHNKSYGKPWSQGDRIGVLLDFGQGTIQFLQNGESAGIAFKNVGGGGMRGLIPAVCLCGDSTKVRLLGFREGQTFISYAALPDTNDTDDGSTDNNGFFVGESTVVKYHGNFKHGRPHGRGEEKWSKREVVGLWQRGKKEGPFRVVLREGGEASAMEKEYFAVFEADEEKHITDENHYNREMSQDTAMTKTSHHEQMVQLAGKFEADRSQFFLWQPTQCSRGLQLSNDLTTVHTVGRPDAGGLVIGSRGFSQGIHYWEVFLEQEEGSDAHTNLMINSGSAMIFVGVAERRENDYSRWRDYGFMNYMAVTSSSSGGERLYGQHMLPNDRIGVLLNMDEGSLTFMREGQAFGQYRFDNYGNAFKYVRSGARGGPTSRVLYPCLGLRAPADPVTIRHTKWLSLHGESAQEALSSVLEAATLLQRWDRPSQQCIQLPSDVQQEAFKKFERMEEGDLVEAKTRIGKSIVFNQSKAAFDRVIEQQGLEFPVYAGAKVFFQKKVVTVLGVFRERIWYLKDGECAWYWNPKELDRAVLDENDDTRASILDNGSSSFDQNHSALRSAFSQFRSWIMNSSWTVEMDEALVQVVNQQCNDSGTDPENLRLKQCPSSYKVGDVFKREENLPMMRARFAVLLSLNKRLSSLFPMVDMTITRSRLTTCSSRRLQIPSAMGRRLANLRGLAFSRTKYQFLQDVLEATVTYTEPAAESFSLTSNIPKLNVNMIRASRKRLEAHSDMHTRLQMSVFGQLFEQTRDWHAAQFRRDYASQHDEGQQRNFVVTLEGEGVDDNGGPYRAVIEKSIGDEAAGPLKLLVPCPNGQIGIGDNQDALLPNPEPPYNDESRSSVAGSVGGLKQFEFLGLLVGTCLRHGILPNVTLPELVWRPLVGLPVRSEDVLRINELVNRSATTLRSLSSKTEPDNESAVDELQQHAVEFAQLVSTPPPQRLLRRARNLTFEDVEDFISAGLESWTQLVEQQLTAFLQGLGGVIPHEILPLFTAAELELMICGEPGIDWGMLKRVAEYVNCSEDTTTIKLFWEIVSEMDQEELSKFLHFVAARNRLPPSPDSFPMPFRLELMNEEAATNGLLPKSATCFFRLSLPPYQDKQRLREKIFFAMQNATTMDGDWRAPARERPIEGFD